MNYSKIIHNYLDGEISQLEEEALFTELASNSELREDFNYQMKIQLVTKHDMNLISPPIECTNKVFSELGFSIPGEMNVHHNNIYRRNAFRLALAALGIAALGIIPYAAWRYSNDFQNSNSQQSRYTTNNNNQSANQSDYTIVSKDHMANATQLTANLLFPTVSSYDNNNSNNISTYSNQSDRSRSAKSNNISNSNSGNSLNILNKKHRHGVNSSQEYNNQQNQEHILSSNDINQNNSSELANDYDSQYGNNKNLSLNPMNSMLEPSSIITSLHGLNSNYAGAQYKTNNTFSEIPLNSSLLNMNNPVVKDNKFSIKFSSFNNKSNISTGMENSQNAWYINRALLISYNFNSYSSLGFELGKENFPQKYTSHNIDNDKAMYEQNPLLNWYGISYQFSMADLTMLNFATPFINSGLSITSVGPICKLEAGLNFKIVNNLNINLSYNAKSLLYRADGELYHSNKYGFVYGFSFSY